MCGATGLGKTHLSLAIANEVIRRGYGVIYVSAPAIIAHYENRMRQRSETDELLDMATDCDLLIIDDLGTEIVSQFTLTALYTLINDRVLCGKPTIISTNLTTDGISRRYNPQIASRLRGNFRRVAFVGDDIRLKKL